MFVNHVVDSGSRSSRADDEEALGALVTRASRAHSPKRLRNGSRGGVGGGDGSSGGGGSRGDGGLSCGQPCGRPAVSDAPAGRQVGLQQINARAVL